MALLEVKSMTKVFGGLVAVENVSFAVNEGEIVALIGPNGAGKTTIFNMLTGIYKLNQGEIYFNGSPIHNHRPQAIVKAGIARTFQNIRLFSSMRVIENVLVGDHINQHYGFLDCVFHTKKYREAERASHQKCIDILESLGLGQYIDVNAKNLPYGSQRKVEIARAIATGAKLIILDEPAAGMNPQESEDLMHFIGSLRDSGHTILLIEHDMNLVMNVSDRIYVLEHGRLIASGLPEQVAHDPHVIEAYLGSGGIAKDEQ